MVLLLFIFFFCFDIIRVDGMCFGIMEDILMLYYEINNIYLELYKLELNGNKDNHFFLELIELLKEKIQEEKVLFKELIGDDYIEYDNLCDLDKEVDTPFAKRISDYMRFNKGLDIEINDEDDEITKKEKLEYINYDKLYIICSRNIYLIYMSFLQECIDDVNYSSLRKRLLNVKYCNSFINHDVENSLVLNNFVVGKDNYTNLYFLTRMLKLDKDTIDRVIVDCYYDMIELTIKQLLSISDIEYNSDDSKAISVNNQCMLKAGLAMCSEKEYDQFRKKIYNLIDELKNDNNKISSGMVYSIIDERVINKSRVRKISLSLRPLED